MSKKITLNNIKNYIDGNGRQILHRLGVSQPHIKEQIAYRLLVCKDDCVVEGKCKVCTCKLPDRAFSTQSCNLERFPNFMSGQEWITYKKEKNIE